MFHQALMQILNNGKLKSNLMFVASSPTPHGSSTNNSVVSSSPPLSPFLASTSRISSSYTPFSTPSCSSMP
ncbi:hypothetical protein SLA2020_474570 [Shorea laevis]